MPRGVYARKKSKKEPQRIQKSRRRSSSETTPPPLAGPVESMQVFPKAPPPSAPKAPVYWGAPPPEVVKKVDDSKALREVPTAGHHNEHIQESVTRIMEYGSWRKQDTVVLVPTGQKVNALCFMTWWNLIFPPNNGAAKYLIRNTEVGEAYSAAIAEILNHPQLQKYKYILTIEHDQTVPQDGILKLVRHMEMHPELHAISGLYWTKGEGGAPQIWGDINDPVVNYRPQPASVSLDGGNTWTRGSPLVECYGIGMGFALWRLDMFKDEKLRKPWFKTVAGVEGVGTQDLYFWADARKHGYRCAVACDVMVGHMDENEKIW